MYNMYYHCFGTEVKAQSLQVLLTQVPGLYLGFLNNGWSPLNILIKFLIYFLCLDMINKSSSLLARTIRGHTQVATLGDILYFSLHFWRFFTYYILLLGMNLINILKLQNRKSFLSVPVLVYVWLNQYLCISVLCYLYVCMI